MHYTDRRAGVANIGKALENLGWKLYGWKADNSDSMTDYYDPESWDGIATKDGVVACVNVSDYTVNSRRGAEITKSKMVRGCDCDRCGGTGDDPSGWTLEMARENPKQWSRACCKMERSVTQEIPVIKLGDPECDTDGNRILLTAGLSGVVSPIPFKGWSGHNEEHDALGEFASSYGHLNCRKCNGWGYMLGDPIVTKVDQYPTFQANPGRSNWHVEAGGTILLKGVGIKPCSEGYGKDSIGAKKSAALAQKIDDARERHINGEPARVASSSRASVDSVTMQLNDQKSGVELIFPDKPSADTLTRVKLAGFHWSRRQGLWYAKQTSKTLAFAEAIVAEFSNTEETANAN